MNYTKSILVSLSLLVAASLPQTQVSSQNANQTSSSVLIDSGKIRYYETHQIRGEETYQINQLPNGELIVQAKTDMPFAGEETRPLVAKGVEVGLNIAPEIHSGN